MGVEEPTSQTSEKKGHKPMNNLAGFKDPSPATSNWIDMDYKSLNLLKYFAEAHNDMFLVRVDHGHGTELAWDVMSGKTIAYRMRHVPTLQRPRIIKFAHIWNLK